MLALNPAFEYKNIMYPIKITSPTNAACSDVSKANFPRFGPIVYCPTKLIGAGIAPVLRLVVSSWADSWVKFGFVIWAVPPIIFCCTTGAEISSPPTKIATCFWMFLSVISANNSPPSGVNSICTNGLPYWSKAVAARLKYWPFSFVSFHGFGVVE